MICSGPRLLVFVPSANVDTAGLSSICIENLRHPFSDHRFDGL
jgi:hypothetical protein